MSGPRNAEDRLRRLLVMLPWLMETGEVALAEVARRFDMTEAQVQNDLELVAMCGLPPFIDEMIDVFVDDGVVFVGVPRLFTRPLRLTAPEAFSLLTSARAAMQLPGADRDGALGRGLAKLAAVLADAGIATTNDPDDTAGVVVDLERPELTDVLAESAATGSELAITYFSPARAEMSSRAIVPRHVYTDGGNWYVVADDDRSNSRRTFRVDRIESAEATGRTVEVEATSPPERFFDDVDVPRATIRFGPEARWVLDQYPIDEVAESGDGWVEARLPVASERWLARLLIRLGPDAVLVAPANENPAAAVARTVLARYGEA
ncbi:MAG: helix-turn-helix transcriptional regulator [Acidobacteriota bacterium]